MLALEELSSIENIEKLNITDLEQAAVLLRKNNLHNLAAVLDDLIAEKHLIDLETAKTLPLSEEDILRVFES